VILERLEGNPISATAASLFRTAGFIKNIVDSIGIPSRPTNKEERSKISLIPESCVAEEFDEGEVVWSAQYHRAAIVKKELDNIDYEERYSSKCYRIYIVEASNSTDSYFPMVEGGGYYAVSLAYDLGRLSHLEEYGVDLSRL